MTSMQAQRRPDKEKLRWMYSQMVLIRTFEERVQQDYMSGKLVGAIHVYVGEEAVAVGVCGQLRKDDYVTSTHRGHGHCIAKGLDLRRMMAELYGKVDGQCRGKGGSMHLCDLERGMLGANGIVSAGLPLACGAALSANLRHTDQVAVAFLGDGASNAGAFHESLNLAAVLKLPVVFVLENNGYADATHIRYAARVTNLADRAAGYGIPGVTVDGMDVLAVHEAAGEAVARARSMRTPTLLECKTYRYYGHYVGDAGQYRSKEEVEAYRQKDCISQLEQRLLQEGILSEGTRREYREQATEAVEDAVRFAQNSPIPGPEVGLEDVYVRY